MLVGKLVHNLTFINMLPFAAAGCGWREEVQQKKKKFNLFSFQDERDGRRRWEKHTLLINRYLLQF